VSAAALKPAEEKMDAAEWGRLIPGSESVFDRRTRKRPQSIRPLGSATSPGAVQEAPPAGRIACLQPRPLQSRVGWNWLRCTTTDWALVCLNWLIVGAVLVPLREQFPQVWSFGYAAGAPIALLGVALLHAALITLIAHTEGLQLVQSDRRKVSEILAKSVIWATSLLCVAYSLQGAPWTISGLICLAGGLHLGALWEARRWLGAYQNPARTQALRVLIIGAGPTGRILAASIAGQAVPDRLLCGFLDDQVPLGDGVIGQVSDLARIARKEFVDEVILAAPRDSGFTRRVLADARRLRLDVEIVPELYGCDPVDEEIKRVGTLPLLCVHAERLPAFALCVKRLLDAVVASAALVVLSPVLAIMAAMIKWDSPGPVFYCAPRAGRKGRFFRCFKFRTMVSNADHFKTHLRRSNERAGPFFKISGDPRITRVGRYLRRYSVDELPQLWNVVRGEMSLVGPRPHPLDDVAAYEISDMARLDVTPGITGLWQVTARRDPSFRRGMELDREYIRTWSLGLDARILLKTLRAVVKGSGE